MKNKPDENIERHYIVAVNAISRRLSAKRKKLKVSQEEMAERCDMSRTMIQRAETAKLNLTVLTLIKLSKGYEIPLHTLVKIN